ncbi:hypothetical protein E2C01_099503 [Portunus trituberculatus]|uniref:Uncharacterized protein n=1 Tax=Portunus trituberculatus TaxID=210409 RepID=A0A5B7KFK2_PORTR|nr:hypothetical protein [Portunus trituberculatus]
MQAKQQQSTPSPQWKPFSASVIRQQSIAATAGMLCPLDAATRTLHRRPRIVHSSLTALLEAHLALSALLEAPLKAIREHVFATQL